ncbi:Kinesin-13 [Giardia muris]|uniref:Kinesin-like protein n=1 Tax=Giardia muris TaxID=5742 RepID=A0A4Z1T5M6_GIAMU|nr:Kinesin-13 [Giardia muris]|eukprot:TNJ28437.1 Kinesin-13 [Giardia muris]
MGDLVLQWLESAGLQAYYPMFEQQGITPQRFVAITIQDYAALGIQSLPDKQKLFRLITNLKSRENITETPAPAPAQVAPPARHQRQPEAQIQMAQDPSLYESYEGSHQDVGPGPAGISASSPGEDEDLVPSIPYHPNAPNPPDPRGIPTVNRTVVPPVGVFLQQIQARIRVVIRKRPINNKELAQNQRDVVTADGWNQVSIHEPKVKVDLTKYTDLHTFKFDHVFNEQSDNHEIYQYAARPLVKSAFEGRNCTIFAYGQTGSGKSYTMMHRENGIYVLAAYDILEYLRRMNSQAANQSKLLIPVVSFFEIYGGKLFDLLNNRQRLQALEDGKGNVQITGLTENQISSVEEMLSLIDTGLTLRAVGATGANADSSRSHAILQIALKYSKSGREYSRISFIDLAGSERASDVQNSDRQTRMEGAEINKSLLALKECIRAMDKAASGNHIPFRGSKLTMVLRDSFVGNSQTVMIANISPNDRSCDNTLNTLRYADRVKELQAGKGGLVKFGVLKMGQNAAEVILGIARDIDGDAYRGAIIGAPANMRNPRPSQQGRPSQPVQAQGQVSESHLRGAEGRETTDEDEMVRTHCDLVDSIFEREDLIVRAHRKQVDAMMQLIKEEVALLHAIENNQISIDDWQVKLSQIISKKEDAIEQLKGELTEFRRALQMEEELSHSLERGKKR